MTQTASPVDSIPIPDTPEWVQHLPDGAVSIDLEDAGIVLRASTKLQERFEALLDKKKAATLTSEEDREYTAICDLDTALSWLNRLARQARSR